jgi:hypothetical protein
MEATVAKSSKRGAKRLSLWEQMRRNPSQAVFYLLGVLIILSMIVALVLEAFPPPPPPPSSAPFPVSWISPFLAGG